MSQSMYTKFVSRCLFPLHERFKSHTTVAILKSLEQSQWYTKQQILAQRNSRLRRFINIVYQSVPYYRTLFDSLNLNPDDIKSAADLAKLPFLTKQLITENSQHFISNCAGSMIKSNTGGSSGVPLTFFLGMDRVSHDVAEKWRATRWWGVDIGDKELVVWGSPIELGSQDRVRQFRDMLLRTQLLSAFELTSEKIIQFLQQIQSYRPKMLFGYPSVYEVLAKYALANDFKMDNLGIKVIFVTAELLYPHQRQLIEQVFGCQVANGYGGRDAGFIAHECPNGGMHISAEDIVVEIVDSNGKVLPDGESGQVVVTHMGSGDFPFIRYQTGDIAKISTTLCSCGRGLPILENIQGRKSDFVVAQDGTMMHGAALTYIVREQEEIHKFKIIQHSILKTHLMLETYSGELLPPIEARIREGFQQRLGEDVEVIIELRKHIPVENSGKHRFVISHAVND